MMGYRRYRCFVDDDDNVVSRDEATHVRISLYSVTRDGTESLEDEWHVKMPDSHDPDPENAKLNAGDDAYHERREIE